MKKLLKKNIFFIILFLGLIVLLILHLVGDRQVDYFSTYEDKYDIALYIKEYHCLPSNYILKDEIEYNTDSTKTVGGDRFNYTDEQLGKFNVDPNAYYIELDLRYDGYDVFNNKRGTHRLVYTISEGEARVFETRNHYKTFTEITNFSIKPLYYISFYILAPYVIISFECFVLVNIFRIKRKYNMEL